MSILYSPLYVSLAVCLQLWVAALPIYKMRKKSGSGAMLLAAVLGVLGLLSLMPIPMHYQWFTTGQQAVAHSLLLAGLVSLLYNYLLTLVPTYQPQLSTSLRLQLVVPCLALIGLPMDTTPPHWALTVATWLCPAGFTGWQLRKWYHYYKAQKTTAAQQFMHAWPWLLGFSVVVLQAAKMPLLALPLNSAEAMSWLTLGYLTVPASLIYRLAVHKQVFNEDFTFLNNVLSRDLNKPELLVAAMMHEMRVNKPWQDPSFGLEDMARRVGRPAVELQHVLEQHLSTRFDTFLETFRVEEAQRLLRDPGYRSLPASQIAQMAGFADPGQFTAVFQQQTGQTPRAFRERHLGNLHAA